MREDQKVLLWRVASFAKALNVSPVTAGKLFDAQLVPHITIDGVRLALESPSVWLERIKTERPNMVPQPVITGEKRRRGRPKMHRPELQVQP